jgi:hypothetical protein
MPKTKISEFSATPANNTDIDSINIAEGCAPSGINDAIRELMAQLKDFQTGAVGDSFNGPIGSTTAAAGAFTTLSASSTLGVTGVSTLTGGAVVQGLTVGRGAGAIATCTAIGSGALQANVIGEQNTAVGYQAGYSNTNGGDGVYIGYQAGYSGTISAASCVFVGSEAGRASNTYNNTMLGHRAGLLSTGNQNTFVGKANVASAMTTGSANTIIGGFSGNQNSLDIRTASNYVVLSDGDGNRQITMAEGQTLALDSAVPNSGTGITFPATQSASTNANTLDDYEEGTWTPSIGGSTTYSDQVGYYTKCGNVVTVSGRMQINSQAGNANTYQITNLPFTGKNTGNGKAGGGVVPVSAGTAISVTSLQTYVDGNSTNMVFCCYTAAATSNSTATIFTNSTDVYFTATYLTA